MGLLRLSSGSGEANGQRLSSPACLQLQAQLWARHRLAVAPARELPHSEKQQKEVEAGEERLSKEGLAENKGLRARPRTVTAAQEGGPHGGKALLDMLLPAKDSTRAQGTGGQFRGKALRDLGLGREKTKPEPTRHGLPRGHTRNLILGIGPSVRVTYTRPGTSANSLCDLTRSHDSSEP